jgi:hypothetical protein
MSLIYMFMVLLGVIGIGLSFWGQGSLKPPYDTINAVGLPLSLIVGLIGVLLLCVPHFFG